jgi:hypothetical protein
MHVLLNYYPVLCLELVISLLAAYGEGHDKLKRCVAAIVVVNPNCITGRQCNDISFLEAAVRRLRASREGDPNNTSP